MMKALSWDHRRRKGVQQDSLEFQLSHGWKRQLQHDVACVWRWQKWKSGKDDDDGEEEGKHLFYLCIPVGKSGENAFIKRSSTSTYSWVTQSNSCTTVVISENHCENREALGGRLPPPRRRKTFLNIKKCLFFSKYLDSFSVRTSPQNFGRSIEQADILLQFAGLLFHSLTDRKPESWYLYF